MPQLQNHIGHYTADAELFDYFVEASPLEADGARRIHEAVLRAAALPRAGLVLDAGSGNGWLATALREGGLRVVSVDIGRRNLREIGRRLPGALTVCADLTHLPFRDGTFTRAISSEVLEHANDPARVLREISAALAPGGLAAISTPYREQLRMSLCIHCNRPTPLNAHLHSFDEQAHGELLRGAGLGLVRSRAVISKVFLQSRLSYLLRGLPFPLWSLVDRALLFLAGRAGTLITVGSRAAAASSAPPSVSHAQPNPPDVN